MLNFYLAPFVVFHLKRHVRIYSQVDNAAIYSNKMTKNWL